KLKTKKEQDVQQLMVQIKDANYGLLSMQRVRVVPENLRRQKLGKIAICQGCGEAYPVRDGDRCRCCQGESPYI
ncbi:MAG: trehalose-binding protein, partial [Syntrophales bacterium]